MLYQLNEKFTMIQYNKKRGKGIIPVNWMEFRDQVVWQTLLDTGMLAGKEDDVHVIADGTLDFPESAFGVFMQLVGTRLGLTYRDPAKLEANRLKVTQAAETRRANDHARWEAMNAERRKTDEEKLPEWLAGKVFYHGLHSLKYVYLRCVDSKDTIWVETTKSMKIKLDEMHRLFKLWKMMMERGESYEANGHKINVETNSGYWTIDRITADGTVIVGCHTVQRSEIERFSLSVGWITEDQLKELPSMVIKVDGNSENAVSEQYGQIDSAV